MKEDFKQLKVDKEIPCETDGEKLFCLWNRMFTHSAT